MFNEYFLNNKFKVKVDMPKCFSNEKVNLLSGKKIVSYELDISVKRLG